MPISEPCPLLLHYQVQGFLSQKSSFILHTASVSSFLFYFYVDMWKQISGAPKIHNLVKNPDILSFYIASRLPLSQTTRQELLEIHGVSYRLQRELQLLKRFNIVRCKSCQVK